MRNNLAILGAPAQAPRLPADMPVDAMQELNSRRTHPLSPIAAAIAALRTPGGVPGVVLADFVRASGLNPAEGLEWLNRLDQEPGHRVTAVREEERGLVLRLVECS